MECERRGKESEEEERNERERQRDADGDEYKRREGPKHCEKSLKEKIEIVHCCDQYDDE